MDLPTVALEAVREYRTTAAAMKYQHAAQERGRVIADGINAAVGEPQQANLDRAVGCLALRLG